MSDQAEGAKRQPLITGHEMTCPRCKVRRDILDFQRFGEIEEYSIETAPIYKCPKQKEKGGCGWIFAPSQAAITTSMLMPPLKPGQEPPTEISEEELYERASQ